MTDRYDETVAVHYAAYRPPLHRIILQKALNGTEIFSRGLDIGCGTGRSSVALAEFCRLVDAVDPSQPMIDAATQHPAITYRIGSAHQVPVPDQSIDIVTFAGSLFYADLGSTVRELCRLCRPNSLVIPYDFNVLVGEVLQRFGIVEKKIDSKYDHAANLSGVPEFKMLLAEREHIEFDASPVEIARLLLADHARHDAFADRYKTTQPLEFLARDLGPSDTGITLNAEIFYSVYRALGVG